MFTSLPGIYDLISLLSCDVHHVPQLPAKSPLLQVAPWAGRNSEVSECPLAIFDESPHRIHGIYKVLTYIFISYLIGQSEPQKPQILDTHCIIDTEANSSATIGLALFAGAIS